jgi:hypothetical protein
MKPEDSLPCLQEAAGQDKINFGSFSLICEGRDSASLNLFNY